MEMLGWNWALIITGVVVFVNIISGYRKGLIKELINCISLLVYHQRFKPLDIMF
jgi:hypothetical protein